MSQGLLSIVKSYFIKPNPCEKLIKYQGTKVEISVSGEALGVNVDLKSIGKQIHEITNATEYAKILDDLQYLLCKEVSNSQGDPKYANSLKKYRITIIFHIARIALIMKQIQDGLLAGLREEIIKISQSIHNLITKLENSLALE